MKCYVCNMECAIEVPCTKCGKIVCPDCRGRHKNCHPKDYSNGMCFSCQKIYIPAGLFTGIIRDNYINNVTGSFITFAGTNNTTVIKEYPYKNHIIINKLNTELYTELISSITYKLINNDITVFKIDRNLVSEKDGERAFTIYSPNFYIKETSVLYKILDNIDFELKKKFIEPSDLELSPTVKKVPGMSFITYRKERDSLGNYQKKFFHKKDLIDVNNPFNSTHLEKYREDERKKIPRITNISQRTERTRNIVDFSDEEEVKEPK